jgi:N-acetylmuramic acid 6-phosphate etherase
VNLQTSQKSKMSTFFLAIDIGGTFIKGAILRGGEYNEFLARRASVPLSRLFTKIEKVPSPFANGKGIDHFIQAINELVNILNPSKITLGGIGVACTGVVNYQGNGIEKTTGALAVLKGTQWKKLLEAHYSCPVVMINDNDATMIGMAELGYLQGTSTIGVMTIGTGLGFSVWRNGRRWRPGGRIPLLGSISTPVGSYNDLASASKLSLLGKDGSLADALSSPLLAHERGRYFSNLAHIIVTGAIIYNLDEICISGGLVDAASFIGFDILAELANYIKETPPELDRLPIIKITNEGNLLQLLGAMSLIAGESIAQSKKRIPRYSEIRTEMPYNKELLLHRYAAGKIVDLLLDAENEAGIQMLDSVPLIADTAERIAAGLQRGGRLIYVGAGTSGRVAAMDAVEIPCTYGLSEDKVITLIAGGVADASIEIESNFEEDASSVPEMLLLNIGEKDIVIGISASGSAWFVQSALAFAASRGAYTVMVQSVMPSEVLPFCYAVIPLCSGNEVVAGSTRMKAGTATKKMLNCLTTTAMILNGEVAGSYMTGLACINEKLIMRAQSILRELYHLSEDDSAKILHANDLDLKRAIGTLEHEYRIGF